MSEEASRPNQTRLLNLITAEIASSLSDPARAAYANQGMVKTLLRHLDEDGEHPDNDIALPPQSHEDKIRYGIMEDYLSILTIFEAFKQCEFYFRRFPFNDLPVSKGEHLRNVCEMYFDRISQFRDRLKNITKRIQRISGRKDDRFGRFIKIFDKMFDWEIRHRNATHHSHRFADGPIDQLSLLDLLRLNPDMSEILPSQKHIYRSEAKEWVKRVRRRAEHLDRIVELIAGFVLELDIFSEVAEN